LSTDAAKTLVQAFISNRLDHCNSLLYGITDNLFRRLQAVQNAAARLITGVRRLEHITPVLRQLHWLPVRQRVHFKLAVMVFKALHTQHHPTWQKTVNSLPLQTAANCDRRPSTRAWSPEQVRVSAIDPSPLLARDSGTACQPDLSLGQFRQALKTHLFVAA